MIRRIGFAVLLLAGLGTTLAHAQVDLSPGVARISLIHGDVSTQRGDSGDWAAAGLNQPIVAGDQVATAPRSRTEVQLDYANILRLGNDSAVKIPTLTRTQIQVQVGQGLTYYTVFKGSEAEVEIDTPNVAIHPDSKEGVYRIEVTGEETRVTARKGSAEIKTEEGSVRLESQHVAIVRGTGGNAEYKLADAPPKDSWDSWNSQRNSLIHNAQSWSHTSPYYTGTQDLDAYGHWANVPDYGFVWFPSVAVGWAPYRLGRWVWEPYWGWTWVSNEPWGWAPYHYGRWFLYGGSWGWWPGPVYPAYRPLWAPAYVSFFGFGGGVGFGFGFGGFGSFGWLPIGPCDHFYPWWGAYRSHFNVVNIANITNVHNFGEGIAPLHGGTQFSNVGLLGAHNPVIRRAVSTVPANQFGTGRIAPRALTSAAFSSGRMLAGNVPVVPTKATLSATNRPASVSSLHGSQQQSFFTNSGPARRPESFERDAAQVQEAIQRNGQFNPVRAGAETERNSAANAPATRNLGQGPSSRANDNGWRRFGVEEAQNRLPNGQSSPAARPSPATRQNDVRGSRQSGPANGPQQNAGPAARQDGWQRFTPRSGQATTQNPGREDADMRARGMAPGAEGRGAVNGPTGERAAGTNRAMSQGGRPPLNLRRPIVQPRGGGGGAVRSYGGGARSGGSHGGGRSR